MEERQREGVETVEWTREWSGKGRVGAVEWMCREIKWNEIRLVLVMKSTYGSCLVAQGKAKRARDKVASGRPAVGYGKQSQTEADTGAGLSFEGRRGSDQREKPWIFSI